MATKLNFLGGSFQGFDDQGNVLALGKVYFYEPGSSTPKDTYTDSTLATANANPVVLNTNGRAAVWLNGNYKVILKDANDNTIDNQNNINPEVATVSDGFNFLTNPSFDDDEGGDNQPDDWNAAAYTGASFSLYTTDQRHGDKCIRCISVGNGGCWYQNAPYFKVDPLLLYQCHFDLLSSVVDIRNVVEVEWYDEDQTLISTSTIFDDSATNPLTWTRKKLYAIAPPATARYGRMHFYGGHPSDSTPGTVYFDNFFFGEYDVSQLVIGDADSTAGNYGAVCGLLSLNVGQRVVVQNIPHSSPGGASLAVDATGAKPIRTVEGHELSKTALRRLQDYTFRYDGTYWVVLDAGIEAGTTQLRFDTLILNGWFNIDNTEKNMTTYEDLYDMWGNDYGLDAGTTFTADSSVNQLNDVAHGHSDNDLLELSNSGGALPNGLAASTKYFVIVVDADTFQVATERDGSAVAFTDNGTGTHSYHTNFKLPKPQGLFLRIQDQGAGLDPDAASRTARADGTSGDNVGTTQGQAVQPLTVDVQAGGTAAGANAAQTSVVNATQTVSINGTGNETRPKNINVRMLVKY